MKTKIMNISGKLLAAIVMLSLVGIGCSSSEETETSQAEAIPVVTQKADFSKGTATHRFSGTVESDRTINMSTKVMGRITELDVEEGDFVKEGDVLIRIKDDNLQAQKSQVESGLLEARAALQNTETNYNRIKNLYEQESATKKELDDISTQYEVAKAKVKTLDSRLREVEDMLAYTKLTAPFDGYVVSRKLTEGDMAGPGQPIIAFEQQNEMNIKVTVPESEIGLFSLEDTVSVDVGAAGYQEMGAVSNINQSGNRGSRQFAVEIALSEQAVANGVKSGMFAEVGLATDKDQAIIVPQAAIVERGQLTGLYTLNDNSEVVLRWVRLGESSGENVEILSGLKAGEIYVSKADRPLSEGQKVNTQ